MSKKAQYKKNARLSFENLAFYVDPALTYFRTLALSSAPVA